MLSTRIQGQRSDRVLVLRYALWVRMLNGDRQGFRLPGGMSLATLRQSGLSRAVGSLDNPRAIWIGRGSFTREQAVQLVREHDRILEPLAVRGFCVLLGYTEPESRAVVDRLYNRDLPTKDAHDEWALKTPVWAGTP